jgi:hypothetical protein
MGKAPPWAIALQNPPTRKTVPYKSSTISVIALSERAIADIINGFDLNFRSMELNPTTLSFLCHPTNVNSPRLYLF